MTYGLHWYRHLPSRSGPPSSIFRHPRRSPPLLLRVPQRAVPLTGRNVGPTQTSAVTTLPSPWRLSRVVSGRTLARDVGGPFTDLLRPYPSEDPGLDLRAVPSPSVSDVCERKISVVLR